MIFAAILGLHREGRPVDAVTVYERLEAERQTARVGTWTEVAELASKAPHAANAVYHAQIVAALAAKRRAIVLAQDVLGRAYDPGVTHDELQEFCERAFFDLGETRAASDSMPIKDQLIEVLERLERRRQGEVLGVGTGLVDLDRILGPIEAGTYVVIGARPSMGKTAFAIEFSLRLAAFGIPSVFASLEMGTREIAERILINRSRVPGEKIRSGHYGDDDMARFDGVYQAVKTQAPIHLLRNGATSVGRIASVCRRLIRIEQRKPEVLFIDYLQLLEPENSRVERHQQVQEMSRQLKLLAGRLGIVVVVLSQINRSAEAREDHRPRMSDLRESGAVEQDADMVLMLYRPEYYDPKDQPGVAEVIVAKNRNGPVGTAKLAFFPSQGRFESLDSGPAGIAY